MPDHRLGTPRDGEQAPFEVIDRIEETLLAAPEVAAEVASETAEQAAQQAVRRNYRWTTIAAVLAALVVSVATSVIAVPIALSASATSSQALASSQSAQRTVDDALTKLDEANRELQGRGQAPVETSPDPDPSEAIQAAVLAQVLAKLPPAPTPEQVAAVLQPAVSAQVVGPSRDTLAQLVSAYFADNPTTPQIQAAVAAYIEAHPPEQGPKGETGDRGLPGQSPPCLSEPAQCRGKDGDNGADSIVPGPPGAPPASWTWTDSLLVEHTCTRSGGSDDAAIYSCT